MLTLLTIVAARRRLRGGSTLFARMVEVSKDRLRGGSDTSIKTSILGRLPLLPWDVATEDASSWPLGVGLREGVSSDRSECELAVIAHLSDKGLSGRYRASL